MFVTVNNTIIVNIIVAFTLLRKLELKLEF